MPDASSGSDSATVDREDSPAARNAVQEERARLAVFLPDLSGGGAERAMLNLAIGLARAGHPVDLLLSKARGPYLAQVPEHIPVIDFDSLTPLHASVKLARYLKERRPVGLVAALSQANIGAVWARQLAGPPTRIVLSTQNTLSVEARSAKSLKLRVMPIFVRAFFRHATVVSGNSLGVADDLAAVAGMAREKVSVLYNPVVTPEVLQRSQEPLDHPWFAPGRKPVVLAVGRLTYQKHHEMLVEAFATLIGKGHPARLMILGEGEERPALEAACKRLGLSLGLDGDVLLPGFVANPYAYMARASLFALSSRYEGLPTVLIEAMACGAPVVSTDCPSGPDEILAGGKYGMLVPVGDAAAMAQAMAQSLAARTPPLAAAWQPFTEEAVTTSYIEALTGSYARK